MPVRHATPSLTPGAEMILSSRMMATRRSVAPGGAQAASPVRSAPGAPGVFAEVQVHGPAGPRLLVERGSGVLHTVAGQCGGSEPEVVSGAFGVGQRARPVGGGLRGALGPRLPRHRVDRQLGGTADDFGGLAGVLYTGQLDDDALLAGAGDARFGDAEGVDALPEDLQGAVGGGRVRLDGAGCLVSRTIWVPPRRSRPSLGDMVKRDEHGDEQRGGSPTARTAVARVMGDPPGWASSSPGLRGEGGARVCGTGPVKGRRAGRPSGRSAHAGQRRPCPYDDEGARAHRSRRDAPRQGKTLRVRWQGAGAGRGNVVLEVGAVGDRARHQTDGGIGDVPGGFGVRGAGAGRGECGSGGCRRAPEKSQDGEEQRGKKVPHLMPRCAVRSLAMRSRVVHS